ncbi:hypothetical protein SteCoe_3376 [Stentor coeruleus]|uniref:Uncharacterized protein n=1 Tax=Stentor coeruleus TaxID=5963 RepID=A0A1R2CXD9_9CILI|nr:hypothetical protein SteCoe_3376 [Stentor coeruleus]
MDGISEKVKKDMIRLPSIINDRSFITDISKVKEGSAQERIIEYHNAIKQQMNSLNGDLDTVLQRHEQDFLNAFKYQMYNLYTQIKDLKKAANNTGANLKHNEELHKLQKSLEWFRKEAIKLGDTVEEYKKEIDILKEKNKELETDCKFYKSKLKIAKKKIKLAKIEQDPKSSIEQVLITTVETNNIPPSPAKYNPSSKSGELIAELLKKHKRNEIGLFKEIEEIMERQAKHYAETSKHYQRIINNERKKIQNLSVIQSSAFLEKSELENLFLDCVEEVKKEIGHRRAKSLRLQKFPLKTRSSPKEKAEVFSPSDKRKIMELLISNEQVLIMLYEKLFPFRASQYGNPQKLEQDISIDASAQEFEEIMKLFPPSIAS